MICSMSLDSLVDSGFLKGILYDFFFPLQFGFRKWKSHVTEQPFEERTEEVKELYSDLNFIRPVTGSMYNPPIVAVYKIINCFVALIPIVKTTSLSHTNPSHPPGSWHCYFEYSFRLSCIVSTLNTIFIFSFQGLPSLLEISYIWFCLAGGSR